MKMRAALLFAALSSVSIAFAEIINVSVGANGKLAFSPEYVHVNQGDVVRFTFNPKAHSVTQSSFDTPCIKTLPGVNSGFDTDLTPVSPDLVAQNQQPTKDFFVIDGSHPLWFYCKQVGHCGQGMVFAINPPATGNTFDAFKARAIQQNGTQSATSSASAPTATATTKFCESKDENGSPLVTEGKPNADNLVGCKYQQAGFCTYNIVSGLLDSGSSVCPDSIPGVVSGSPNLPTAKLCRPKDERGSPLTLEGDVHDGSVGCTYPQAGLCEYTVSSGERMSGSSDCPDTIAPTTGSNVKAVSGALADDDDDDKSSANLKTLVTNSFIIIGLSCAILLAIIVMAMVSCIGRRGFRGKEAKYSKVTVPKAFQGHEDDSMIHSDSKPYNDI